MRKPLPVPTQLVAGMSHREMLDIMAENGVFCSPDRFARILQDAQRRALADQAMTKLTEENEKLGLYNESEKAA